MTPGQGPGLVGATFEDPPVLGNCVPVLPCLTAGPRPVVGLSPGPVWWWGREAGDAGVPCLGVPTKLPPNQDYTLFRFGTGGRGARLPA